MYSLIIISILSKDLFVIFRQIEDSTLVNVMIIA